MSVFRIAEFLDNIAQLELKQGKTEKCQNRLEQLKGILQPVLKSCSKGKHSKEGFEEPLFIGHPETCECVSCIDPALHTILINYLMSLSKYLSSISRCDQSMNILGMTETVCECAERKMINILEKLQVSCVGGVESNEGRLKESKKKSRAKSSKGRKQKEDTDLKNSSPQLMLSQDRITVHCMKGELLLQNGRVEKGSDELSKAMEILHCLENAVGNNPVYLLPVKAFLLQLYGVTTLVLNRGSSSNAGVDCNWFSRHAIEVVSRDDTVVARDSVKTDLAQEEIEKPRKGSSRRGKSRSSKSAEKMCVEDDSKPKSSKAKGRGRSKKVEEAVTEGDESDASIQQKSKRSKKPTQSSKPSSDVDGSKTGMTTLCLFIWGHYLSRVK